MTKASDNVFPKVILGPLGAPTAPADASWKLYPMADGVYARSSNTVVGPLGPGGVTSLSHASNTYTGAVTLAPGNNVAITSPTSGTFTIHSSATGGGVSLGAWTDYTPTLTATTTNPTLGSSTVSGRYKALDSKTYIVVVNFAVTIGGAWNAGSGEYRFSLPAGLTSAARSQTLSAHLLDGGTARYAGIALVTASATVIGPVVFADATGDRVLKHNVPVTWATGDGVDIMGIVEVV